jgi:hypothetical protein
MFAQIQYAHQINTFPLPDECWYTIILQVERVYSIMNGWMDRSIDGWMDVSTCGSSITYAKTLADKRIYRADAVW